jgi:hypothetical protein
MNIQNIQSKMDSFKIKMILLPKEIQDHISSFNYEHRIIMKKLCEEINIVECDNCCNNFISKKNAFKNTMMWKEYYYCSEWCLEDDEHHFRKALKNDMRTNPNKYSQYKKS